MAKNDFNHPSVAATMCYKCQSVSGNPCKTKDGKMTDTHKIRKDTYAKMQFKKWQKNLKIETVNE